MEHLTVEIAHALLAGTLPPDEEAAWRTHLLACQDCRALLAGEAALERVLDLGDAAPGPTEPDPERLARRLERLAPDAPRRIRRRHTWTALEVAAVVGLAGSLGWQLARSTRAPEDVARALGVTPDLQRRVVNHLDALEVLASDPWLIEDYDTVRTLEQFIFEPES